VRKVDPERFEENRRLIIEAARVCYSRQGFLKAGMSDICEEAGFSAGNIYHYFSNKAELQNAVARDSVESALSHLAKLLRGPELGRSLLKLDKFMDVWTKSWGLGPGLRHELVSEAERNETIRLILNDQYKRVTEILTIAIVDGQASGEISSDVPVAHLVRIIELIWSGLSTHKITDPDFDFKTYQKSVEMVLRPWFGGKKAVKKKRS
jgi:TetR/AcrR family transcriptional regulator, repressor for uid operon